MYLKKQAIRTFLAATTSLATFSGPALSQEDVAGSDDADVAVDDVRALETIYVTARKKEENIQNIPVAASVISAERISDYAIEDVEQLTNIAPQLMIARSAAGTGAAIALRGISVNTTSISLEQSVATVIDGVYYNGGRALAQALFDVERVEVLKGPQSLFHGKNTTAGVISITTANPTFEFSAMGRVGYEFVGETPALEGHVNIPLSDVLAFRAAARWHKQLGSFFDQETVAETVTLRDVATGDTETQTIPAGPTPLPGEQSTAVRLGLLFDPEGGFEVLLKGTYTTNETNGINSTQVRFFCPSGSAQTGAIAAPCGERRAIAEQGLSPDVAAVNPIHNRRGGDPFTDYEAMNLTADFFYDNEYFALSVVPAYVDWEFGYLGDFDQSVGHPAAGVDGSHAGEFSSSEAFSVEARFETAFSGPVNFMVGGYYQDQELTFEQDIMFPGGLFNSAAADPAWTYLTISKESSTQSETLAFFAQVLWDISDTLNLAVGARYTDETKDSVFSQPYVVPGFDATFDPTTLTADQSFDNFSPEVMLTWTPTNDLTLYGGYKTGYKSGGFSISGLITVGQDPNEPAFDQEEVEGFEGGVKSTLLDNQLRLNLDLFRYNYTDLQVDYFAAATTTYLTLNAGEARTQGGELQIEYVPAEVEGLTLSGTIGYTHAEYTSFPFAPCLAGQSIADGCTIGPTPEGVRPFQDLKGQPTQQAPKWTASANVHYEFPVADNLIVGLSGNAHYRSSYHLNPFVTRETARFIQDGYVALNLSARIGPLDDNWELALIAKNLTDEFIVHMGRDLPFTGSGSGTAAAIPGDAVGPANDPRTIALQFTKRF